MVYTSGQVQPKCLINAATFATGYVTPNDHWTNYWRLGPNSGRVGWYANPDNTGSIDLAANPEYAEGDGAASLGRELARSQAFSDKFCFVCCVKLYSSAFPCSARNRPALLHQQGLIVTYRTLYARTTT